MQMIRPFTATNQRLNPVKRRRDLQESPLQFRCSGADAIEAGVRQQGPYADPNTGTQDITLATQCSRRAAIFGTSLGLLAVAQGYSVSSAGAEALTLADVTPAVAPAGPLTAR
jgi:hypothetical protein